jgi:hypothetical protein
MPTIAWIGLGLLWGGAVCAISMGLSYARRPGPLPFLPCSLLLIAHLLLALPWGWMLVGPLDVAVLAFSVHSFVRRHHQARRKARAARDSQRIDVVVEGPTFQGSRSEPDCIPLDLPLTLATLRGLLEHGLDPGSHYSHQQIAEWSHRFWKDCQQASLTSPTPPEVQRAAEIAAEIEAHWERFIFDNYTLSALQYLDLSTVRLPDAQMQAWLERLDLVMV